MKLYFVLFLLFFYLGVETYTTKREKIDKIYIMNLDSSTQRFEKIKDRLKDFNLPTEPVKFSAVNGRDVVFIDILNNKKLTGAEIIAGQIILKGKYKILCDENNLEDYIFVTLNWDVYHQRGIGEIGQTCTSRKIWKDILKNNYHNSVIMEDDVSFIPYFDIWLKTIMLTTPKDYDLLYLNIYDHWVSYTYKQKYENQIIRFALNIFDQYVRNIFWKKIRRRVVSAQTLVVSAQGAAKLLEYTKNMPYNVLVADVTFCLLIEEEKIKAYSSKPLLTKPDFSIASDVSNL